MTTSPILDATTDHPDALALPTWAVLEALGHQRHGGYLRETTVLGTTFARLDIPTVGAGLDEQAVTLLYHPNSIWRIVPVDEATARRVARSERFSPLNHWELPDPDRDDDEPPL